MGDCLEEKTRVFRLAGKDFPGSMIPGNETIELKEAGTQEEETKGTFVGRKSVKSSPASDRCQGVKAVL